MLPLALFFANILLFVAIIAIFFIIFKWLIPKVGLPPEATNVLIIIVVLLVIVYVLKQGFPF